jgi:hypothetical protein
MRPNDIPAEVSSELRADVAKLKRELEERDEWFTYELLHGSYDLGSTLYAPCGCKAMVAGSYRVCGERRLYTGDVEECQTHKEDYDRA